MKYLKVNLWGQEIGRLVWDSAARQTYFMYNPERHKDIPDIAPACCCRYTATSVRCIRGFLRLLPTRFPIPGETHSSISG